MYIKSLSKSTKAGRWKLFRCTGPIVLRAQCFRWNMSRQRITWWFAHRLGHGSQSKQYIHVHHTWYNSFLPHDVGWYLWRWRIYKPFAHLERGGAVSLNLLPWKFTCSHCTNFTKSRPRPPTCTQQTKLSFAPNHPHREEKPITLYWSVDDTIKVVHF